MTREDIIRAINLAAEQDDAETVRELGALLNKLQPPQPSVMDAPVGAGRALAAGVAQGGTLGWGDEIQGRIGAGADQAYAGLRGAGVPAVIAAPLGFMTGGIPGLFQGGEEAEYLTEQSRDELRRARDQRPVLAYGGEVAGALATGAGTGAVLAPAANAGRLAAGARYAGIGMGEGALYGAGAGEEGQRLPGAVLGGVLGGGAAVAVPGAFSLGKMTWERLRNALTSTDDAVNLHARRMLSEVARAEGRSPEEIVEMLRQSWNTRGPQDAPMTLADVSDMFRGSMVTAMRGSPMDDRELARGFYAARGSGAPGRLDDAAQDVLGARGRTYAGTLEELRERAQAMGNQEYTALFRGEGAQGVAVPDWLRNRMSKNPDLQKAWREAQRLMTGLGDEVPGNAARLHYMKQYLSSQARATDNRALSAMYKKNAAEIQGYLDEAVEGYGELSARRADIYKIEEAAEAGRDFFRGRRPFEEVDRWAGIQGDELDAFRVGIRDALRQRLMDAGGDPSKMLPARQRDMLRRVFDDNDIEALIRQVDHEAQLMRTQSVAEKTLAQLAENPQLMTGGMLATVGLGQKVLMAAQLLSRLRAVAKHMDGEDHAALLRLLSTPIRNADDAAKLERALTPLTERYLKSAGAAGAMGGQTAAGILEE